MSLSLSHGKTLNVGHHGIAQDELPPMDQGRLDPRGWFKDAEGKLPAADRPLELEIGSGKGTFLVQHAQLYPGVDYLGIEWAKAFWRYAADRARRHGLENVRLLRCDAAVFVRHYVPDATFRQIHIYFPDPWPKKRHHKRRLVQADFLRELHRVLIPAGQEVHGETACVRLATDHADYFEWMGEHAAQVTDLFEREPFERPKSAGEGELVGTNFERKYRKEGRVFQGMILRKRP
ncbi:MAG: tRNA (guanosine(46)-N7)-methyltransferase TrmB [Phycisphaerales bacterium]